MNETATTIRLAEAMKGSEGWGRAQGREVHPQLVEMVEGRPGIWIYYVSLEGVRRIDISFASETVVEVARRYRGRKGFCLVDVEDADLIENIEAAATRKDQPIMLRDKTGFRVLGPQPRQGGLGAFEFALKQPSIRAADYAKATRGVSITNASTKFKQLWEQGFLLRHEDAAESGGKEFVYFRIG